MFCLTNCKELAQGYPTPWQWGSLVRVSVEAHFFLVGASVESQFGDDTVLALTGCGFPSPFFSQYVKKKRLSLGSMKEKKLTKRVPADEQVDTGSGEKKKRKLSSY